MAVDPTGRDLADFLAGDPDSPVVRLNLPRFADGGRESYARASSTVAARFPGRRTRPSIIHAHCNGRRAHGR